MAKGSCSLVGIVVVIGLIIIAVTLFLFVQKGWISNSTLQILANIAGVVALIAAVAMFIVPPSILPEPLTESELSTNISTSNTVTIRDTPIILPTPTSTSTPSPTIAITSIPLPTTVAHVPPSAVIPSTTPTATPTEPKIVVAPVTKIGRLFVKLPKECDSTTFYFNIEVDSQSMGVFHTGEEISMAVGTYDTVIQGDLLNNLIRQDVVISEGETTVVDFAQEIGSLILIGYPDLKWPDRFGVSHRNGNSTWAYNGVQICGLPGKYNVTISVIGEPIVFEIELKAGENTVVGPDTWPEQLGLLSLDPPQGRVSVKVFDMQTGERIGNYPDYVVESIDYTTWMLPGIYKIVIIDPYPGLIFENVQIRAKEETVLKLPD